MTGRCGKPVLDIRALLTCNIVIKMYKNMPRGTMKVKNPFGIKGVQMKLVKNFKHRTSLNI